MEILKEVLRSLLANKMRTFLSMLGIVIGVTAVIMVMSLGAGMRESVTERLTSLGSNIIMVTPGFIGGRGGTIAQSVESLSEEDVSDILSMCPSVDRAIGLVNGNFLVQYRETNSRANVYAAPYEIFQILNLKVSSGRTFTEEDSAANVAIIGQEIAYNLFENENPVGKKIYLVQGNRKLVFEIIGVFKRTGSILMFNPDNMILIPYETGKFRVFQTHGNISMILATSKSPQVAQRAVMEIDHLLYTKFHEEESYYNIISQQAILNVVSESVSIINLVLVAIAAVSLVVGGIGIMNIMLVSVVERTREIGIKMAIGASRIRILMEFLVESVVITFVAGAIGVALGILGSNTIVNTFGSSYGLKAFVDPFSVIIAFGVSASVGLFFGFYPAYRASRLSPIEALRYE
ncbi:ABC transporter substrate-binding protein [Thermotoga sp. RQ7]|uniref:ABC transporter permease n=1 Tax=Thermotoga sp. RQ7 TaxID=126738 RepID=UPI0005A3107E|nr:ABC transporter permease [Thermotoga sp. RQ7]AJG40414.1 ABC transporter substrate-binding protein [Thermotoga sp. RQ7]